MVSTNLVLGVVILFLAATLFFVSFFSSYLRQWANPPSVPNRHDDDANQPAGSPLITRQPRGLDFTIIDTFPTFDHSSIKSFKIGNQTLDCYVCLNEFHGHETLRLIPTCDHVFHVECIDAWLDLNTTCPVCRANLADPVQQSQTETETGNERSTEDGSAEEPEAPPRGKLSRSRTWLNSRSGHSRWSTLGRYARSKSTGRVGDMAMERFTLRVPEEVRREIIVNGELRRARSCDASRKEGGSRRERGGSHEKERRWGRWLSTGGRWVSSIPPMVFRSKSVGLEMTVESVSDCATTSQMV